MYSCFSICLLFRGAFSQSTVLHNSMFENIVSETTSVPTPYLDYPEPYYPVCNMPPLQNKGYKKLPTSLLAMLIM